MADELDVAALVTVKEALPLAPPQTSVATRVYAPGETVDGMVIVALNDPSGMEFAEAIGDPLPQDGEAEIAMLFAEGAATFVFGSRW